MIQVSNLYLPSRLFILLAVDGSLLTAAVFLSLRTLTPGRAAAVSAIAAAVFIACLYLFDLYSPA